MKKKGSDERGTGSSDEEICEEDRERQLEEVKMGG
jgi:hypothetical protein